MIRDSGTEQYVASLDNRKDRALGSNDLFGDECGGDNGGMLSSGSTGG